MDYYNCNDSARINHEMRRIERHRMYQSENLASRTRNTDKCCQTFASNDITASTKLLHIPDVPTGRQNICEVCEQFTLQHHMRAPLDPHALLTTHNCGSTIANAPHNFAMPLKNSCLHMENFYSPFSHFELCCRDNPRCSTQCVCNIHQQSSVESSSIFLTKTVDSLVWESNEFCTDCAVTSRHGCSTFKIGNHGDDCGYNYKNVYSYKNCTHCEAFTGLGCRTNKSVNFFAMRLDLYQDFARRLGIYNNLEDGSVLRTAVAVVDIKVNRFIIVYCRFLKAGINAF